MKTAEGIVIEVVGNTARIKVGKHNDCQNCGACPGSNSVVVSAKNPQGAKPGQRVIFEVKETNALIAAFIVFIFPLIGILVGVLLGGLIGQLAGGFHVGFQVIGGVVMFALSVIGIKLFDHYANNNEKAKPSILKIL
ncbi:SoxR reducing system RseC family protein [Konateibacter massiliensis]|uniref:SoxR reducing system RseC family protein n=1 Tax=Konateibacter massiliensis TaxID=2002841 RepID=UPI000C1476AC|nr:SoxR reducing system RseC family protein [Konateibacter massiliensis]